MKGHKEKNKLWKIKKTASEIKGLTQEPSFNSVVINRSIGMLIWRQEDNDKDDQNRYYPQRISDSLAGR
jgi:hypothetical protein